MKIFVGGFRVGWSPLNWAIFASSLCFCDLFLRSMCRTGTFFMYAKISSI